MLVEGNEKTIKQFESLHPKFQTVGYKEMKVNLHIPSNLMLLLDGWYQDDTPDIISGRSPVC